MVYLFLNQNICFGYLEEPSQWDSSFEYPKQLLKGMEKNIHNLQLKIFSKFHYKTEINSLLDTICSPSKFNFLISQPKHMLWVLKRTVSMRWFFWAHKTNVKLMEKKISTILSCQKNIAEINALLDTTCSPHHVCDKYILFNILLQNNKQTRLKDTSEQASNSTQFTPDYISVKVHQNLISALKPQFHWH